MRMAINADTRHSGEPRHSLPRAHSAPFSALQLQLRHSWLATGRVHGNRTDRVPVEVDPSPLRPAFETCPRRLLRIATEQSMSIRSELARPLVRTESLGGGWQSHHSLELRRARIHALAQKKALHRTMCWSAREGGEGSRVATAGGRAPTDAGQEKIAVALSRPRNHSASRLPPPRTRANLCGQYRAVWCRNASSPLNREEAGCRSFARSDKRMRQIRASGRRSHSLGWWGRPCARSRPGRPVTRCPATFTAGGWRRCSELASKSWDSERCRAVSRTPSRHRSAGEVDPRGRCAASTPRSCG